MKFPRDPIQEAEGYGIDVSQLRDNLALAIEERVRRHQIALNTVEKFQGAKKYERANNYTTGIRCNIVSNDLGHH